MVSACFWSAVIFEVISVIFLIFKERIIYFISRTKKKKFDTYKLSKSISNIFFIAGLIIILGVILSNIVIDEKLASTSLIISVVFIVISNISIMSKKFFAEYNE